MTHLIAVKAQLVVVQHDTNSALQAVDLGEMEVILAALDDSRGILARRCDEFTGTGPEYCDVPRTWN